MNNTVQPHQKATTTIIEQIKEESTRLQGLIIEIAKTIVGQGDIINTLVMAVLSHGHILLEGVPGVAKTTMIKAFANALGLQFKRIQFTPDLLPADLIGTLIFNQKTHEFDTKKGPIFANLILADEINRAPAKVQAALLEAMQERQVTIGSQTFKLEEPFLVFATQNPIEQEGTYRLPEAQLDRFMFKLLVHYPSVIEEREIIRRSNVLIPTQQVLSRENIIEAQDLVQQVYVDEKIIDYIVNIVFATRMPHEYKLRELTPYISYGVSPRATLALYHAGKAQAFLDGRHFVTPNNIKSVACSVLRHRLVLSYEAEAAQISSDDIIHKILDTIVAP
jgi:MoxR-like ATPase